MSRVFFFFSKALFVVVLRNFWLFGLYNCQERYFFGLWFSNLFFSAMLISFFFFLVNKLPKFFFWCMVVFFLYDFSFFYFFFFLPKFCLCIYGKPTICVSFIDRKVINGTVCDMLLCFIITITITRLFCPALCISHTKSI